MQDLDKKSYPSENQIRELWEWCGIKPDYVDYVVSGGYTNQPKPIYPPIDLNNLFKYAVPKLQDDYAVARVLSDWLNRMQTDYQKAADYLFWAIWEAKHG